VFWLDLTGEGPRNELLESQKWVSHQHSGKRKELALLSSVGARHNQGDFRFRERKSTTLARREAGDTRGNLWEHVETAFARIWSTDRNVAGLRAFCPNVEEGVISGKPEKKREVIGAGSDSIGRFHGASTLAGVKAVAIKLLIGSKSSERGNAGTRF